MSKDYTAEVRWEDGQWQASVTDVPGAHTFARTLSALRKRLREVIVLMDDRPDSELEDERAFDVVLWVKIPQDLTSEFMAQSGPRDVMTVVRPEQALQMAADARERAAKAEAEAEHTTTVAVLMGQQAGISLRDMAVLLGVSHQRVAQIAASTSQGATAPPVQRTR
jgi:predicted RNase H-like HicB family nuclease